MANIMTTHKVSNMLDAIVGELVARERTVSRSARIAAAFTVSPAVVS
jgi:hypothetical protein